MRSLSAPSIESRASNALEILGVYVLAALGTWVLRGTNLELLVPLTVGLSCSLIALGVLSNFRGAGRLLLATNVQLSLWSLMWGSWFIATLPISALTKVLMFAGFPLLILTLPVGLMQTFEQWEVLCRRNWLRPRTPLAVLPRTSYPRVCLQVPVYAEPPELVMATLDALARLRYPNFEVMVIDNNTKDPDLWKPLEAYCRKLGERFRFFHVEQLPGAKAGALNFAMRHINPDVEVIGVVDSDYQAEPDFLESLIGYFDNPKMGFVQTPHDYRDWEGSLYQRMCYWEYKIFFETTMVSLNERDAALTVGTMCLIRRRALEEAGGWSEWCQTEDSELSIRIHACGYSSVYVPVTYGRGLIPETFAGYKKQRFRWTYGPIQEFRHHLSLFLPKPLAETSALTPWQKVHHLNHGLGPFSNGLGLLLTPVGLAVVVSMWFQSETVQLPQVVWLVAVLQSVTGFALTWLAYRVLMGCTLKDALGAMVAKQSLSYIATLANIWGLFTDRIPWRRTNKFKALPAGLAALNSVLPELSLGLGMVLVGAGALVLLAPVGLVFFLSTGLVVQGLTYLSAPALALLAEHELQLQQAGVPVQPVPVIGRGDWLGRLQPAATGFAAVVAVACLGYGLNLWQSRTPVEVAQSTSERRVAVMPARTSVQNAATGSQNTGTVLTARSLPPGLEPDDAGTPDGAFTREVSTRQETGTQVVAMVRNPKPLIVPEKLGPVIEPPMPIEETPGEDIAGMMPLDVPRMATATPVEMVAWNPASRVPDCYDTRFKTNDYRCRNRKN
ncbi:MAG: glycosyltransferase [Gemmatimonadaceae bacterium]|nr:glycosyltransferase [Gloeobacterales cyanobacterium ES-bin-141]